MFVPSHVVLLTRLLGHPFKDSLRCFGWIFRTQEGEKQLNNYSRLVAGGHDDKILGPAGWTWPKVKGQGKGFQA